MLELIGADGCQYPDDTCLFGILDLFFGGTPERPSAPVESDNHCSHSADGCALQQTRQRFSSEELEGSCMVVPFARHVPEQSTGYPDGFRFCKLNPSPN